MDTFVVRQDKSTPFNPKPLKRPGWEGGMREIEGRLSFTRRRNLLSLLLRSYQEIGIFSHSDSSFGHQSTVHLNPTQEFVPVEIFPHGRGNLRGREWISGVEFDSKGVYLASVTNIGCLSVHDYETLYCKSTSNQTKHGKKEKDFRDDTKPILHISTHEKLDAVHWNPTNQDEVGCVSERSSKILLFDIACMSLEPSEVLKRKPKSSLLQNMEHIGLSDMAFSHSDKFRILACGLDGNLHLWDRRASKFSCSVMSVPSPISPLSSLQLTSDEQVAIVGSKYGNVYAWDLRGGRTSAAFLSHKEVYHPPLVTIKIASLLEKISSLKAQTEIGSSGIESINVDPSCRYQLAFHLSNGWSGILNLNSLKVTHIHCPPPPWIKDNSLTMYVYHKRKPAWLPTDSIYAVGSSHGNGINFLDFSPDMKSSCYVTYDNDDFQTEIEERDEHSVNHFLQASASVVACAAHPLSTSIVGGTEGGSLVLIAQNNESISGEDSLSDEQVKSGVHSEMS